MFWNRRRRHEFPRFHQMAGYEIAEKAAWILGRHPEYEPVEVTVPKGICSSWWGQTWCKNLERYADWSNRIGRGKKYVREGAVVDLKIKAGHITASVLGSRDSPYSVNIMIKPLSKERQEEIENLASGKIQNLEALAFGNFPEDLKDSFFKEGFLFPEPDDIDFHCTCPDWAYMCKHVAAVLYEIGVRLDSESLLFFQMRGVDIEKFISNVVGGKVEKMLANMKNQSKRIFDEADLNEIFEIDCGDLIPRSEIPKETAKPEQDNNEAIVTSVVPETGSNETPPAMKQPDKKQLKKAVTNRVKESGETEIVKPVKIKRNVLSEPKKQHTREMSQAEIENAALKEQIAQLTEEITQLKAEFEKLLRS